MIIGFIPVRLFGEERLVLSVVVIVSLVVRVLLVVVVVEGVVHLGLVAVHVRGRGLGHGDGGHQVGGVGVRAGVTEDTAWNKHGERLFQYVGNLIQSREHIL